MSDVADPDVQDVTDPDVQVPKGILKQGGLFLLISVLTFALVEGCTSLVMAAFDTPRADDLTYSQYDAELGWVNIPSIELLDLWGPGKGLLTNSQGFRAETDIEPAVAPGRIRIVCSGNSFAFGEGVGNRDTWCHLLTHYDERIEAVNLGQAGYGVGQSYLRYLRDGAPLDHQIHLFTFVDGDFDRAGRRAHYGYARPVLRLNGDELEVDNQPVPRVLPTVARFAIRLSERLRSVEFASRMVNRVRPPRPRGDVEERARLAPVVERLFREVEQVNRDKHSAVVFVYLPTASELDHELPWRGWVRPVLDSLGSHFIDLTPALRELPPDVASEFFLPPGSPAAGHYSRAGNAWVGEALYARLRSVLPETLGETEKAVEVVPD
jgi:hypothetical protein